MCKDDSLFEIVLDGCNYLMIDPDSNYNPQELGCKNYDDEVGINDAIYAYVMGWA